jgi:hypothetical protein
MISVVLALEAENQPQNPCSNNNSEEYHRLLGLLVLAARGAHRDLVAVVTTTHARNGGAVDAETRLTLVALVDRRVIALRALGQLRLVGRDNTGSHL